MLIVSAIFGILLIAGTLGAVPYLILMERKIAAYVQDRIGPNRVGPRGVLQPVADGLKLFFKEHFIPAQANKVLFFLAPALSMFSAMSVMAVIPFAGLLKLPWFDQTFAMQIAPGLDIGIIFLVMMATGGVYGIVIGGWASNNKYSFFGGLRSVAQMLSYEVPFGLCLLCMVLMTGNLRLEVVVEKQLQFGWFILYQPITFILMFVCALAECNRLPFDTPEAEQELVVGYHTEYSSMEFGMFFLGEYAHIIASSALLSTLFLGGWHFPMLTPAVEGGIFQTIIKLAVISAKIFVFIFVFMLARWTLPRFRFDQTLRIGWLGLVPMSMSLVILTGVMTYLKLERTVWMTLANIGVVVAAYLVGWLVMLTKKKLPEEAV